MNNRDNSVADNPEEFPDSRHHFVAVVGDGEAPRLASADRGLPLDLLSERAGVLAGRARDGSLPFLDAVDMAYSAAQWSGLVDRYGDDVVQLVLADAFAGSRQQ
jgi:hypothetical protein